MSALPAAAQPQRRVGLVLLAALTLVLAVADIHELARGGGAGPLRALGLPGWLHPGILGGELLAIALLWPRRTMVAGAWLLAAVIAVAGVIHVAAGQLPLEYVLYLAVVYALVRLRTRGVS